MASLTSQHVIILLKTCWLGDSDSRSCWFNGQPLWTAMGVGRLPMSDVEVLLYLFCLFAWLLAWFVPPVVVCSFCFVALIVFCASFSFLYHLQAVLILVAPKFENMLDATARRQCFYSMDMKPEKRALRWNPVIFCPGGEFPQLILFYRELRENQKKLLGNASMADILKVLRAIMGYQPLFWIWIIHHHTSTIHPPKFNRKGHVLRLFQAVKNSNPSTISCM